MPSVLDRVGEYGGHKIDARSELPKDMIGVAVSVGEDTQLFALPNQVTAGQFMDDAGCYLGMRSSEIVSASKFGE